MGVLFEEEGGGGGEKGDGWGIADDEDGGGGGGVKGEAVSPNALLFPSPKPRWCGPSGGGGENGWCGSVWVKRGSGMAKRR